MFRNTQTPRFLTKMWAIGSKTEGGPEHVVKQMSTRVAVPAKTALKDRWWLLENNTEVLNFNTKHEEVLKAKGSTWGKVAVKGFILPCWIGTLFYYSLPFGRRIYGGGGTALIPGAFTEKIPAEFRKK